jgi:N-acetylglucosaminyl-diphospho-decaprenol L-rhamnosyltransferase
MNAVKNPLLSVVIVNWNAGQQLLDCVHALLNSTFTDLQIWVVDNNSSDHSMANLPVDQRIHTLLNSDNKGFGAACNQAIMQCRSPYLLLLNPDTQVRPDTLSQAVDFLNGNQEIAILGCRHVNEMGQTQPSCSRFPTLAHYLNDILGLSKLLPKQFKPATIMTDMDYGKSTFVDQVMGAFFLFRQSVVGKAGLFDERFFVYYEELDLSRRAASLGMRSYYHADITIFHKGGGTSEQVKARRTFYSLRSRLNYAYKHFSRIQFILLLALTIIIEPFTRIGFLLLRGQLTGISETIKSYDYLIRQLLTGRLSS